VVIFVVPFSENRALFFGLAGTGGSRDTVYYGLTADCYAIGRFLRNLVCDQIGKAKRAKSGSFAEPVLSAL
jgi:hypothetical protein